MNAIPSTTAAAPRAASAAEIAALTASGLQARAGLSTAGAQALAHLAFKEEMARAGDPRAEDYGRLLSTHSPAAIGEAAGAYYDASAATRAAFTSGRSGYVALVKAEAAGRIRVLGR